MNVRYKWYKVKIPKGIEFLQDGISSIPFSDSSNEGFLKLGGGLDQEKYRFLWRTKVPFFKLDEHGNPSSDEIESINNVDFSFISVSSHHYLRIKNPGRSLRTLMNSLESIAGIGFSVKPVYFKDFKNHNWATQEDIVTLRGVKLSGVVLEEGVVAKLEINSNTELSLDQLKCINHSNYQIDSAAYNIAHQGVKGKLTIMSNGTVKINGQLKPRILALLEKTILTE